MTEASRRLLALARTNTACYAHPNLRAVLLVGSVSRGEADGVSDIDMSCYYDVLPTAEEVEAGFEKTGGGERQMLFSDPNEGFVEQYVVQNVVCQCGHVTLESIDKVLTEVIDKFDTGDDNLTILSGIVDGVPLLGEEHIAPWKTKAAAYPQELVQAVIRQNLRFYPLWIMERMIAGRGDTLFLYQALVEAEKNLVRIALALNRRYPPHDFKRMDTLLGGLAIAPRDFSARLKTILREEPAIALNLLVSAIDETLALVDQHLPSVDTDPARKRLHSAQKGLGT